MRSHREVPKANSSSAATDAVIRRLFLLADDREAVLARARAHWVFATESPR